MKWFSSQREGKLRTMMGNIPFEYGDYLLSQGVIYQIDFDTAVNRLLYVESFAPIYTPPKR
jgi:homogentisate 1,2-dioxygenase